MLHKNLDTNTVLLVIGALVVAIGAYWFFFTGSGNQPPLSAGTQNAAQGQFQTLIGELSPITFDTSIFTDPRFDALVDLATPIAPESAGRLDPFAPVPGVTGQ